MCESSVKFRWALISLREIGLLINHTRIFMKRISHIDIYIWFTHILKLAHTLFALLYMGTSESRNSMKKNRPCHNCTELKNRIHTKKKCECFSCVFHFAIESFRMFYCVEI